MTGHKQVFPTFTKKARSPSRRQARRNCFRPGPVIPRQVAPLQSPTPFHQTTLP
jgi:hypothetical protein